VFIEHVREDWEPVFLSDGAPQPCIAPVIGWGFNRLSHVPPARDNMAFCRPSANGVPVQKVLIGIVVAGLLVVGGFFGYKFYVQYRIDSEIEAAFAQIRAAGGQASHGKVSFDPLSRTVSIADIAAEITTPMPLHVKIASFTATGARLADETRFAAETVETTDVEFSFQAGWSFAYKAPSLIIKDLSGPAGPQVREKGGPGADDVYLWALQRIATISSTSITAPSVTATVSLPGASEAQSVE
jgi:hypothetical protein